MAVVANGLFYYAIMQYSDVLIMSHITRHALRGLHKV